MGDNGRPAGAVGHGDGVQRLGQGADLVELDEHGVGAAELNALPDALGVGEANREVFIVPEYADGWNAARDYILAFINKL